VTGPRARREGSARWDAVLDHEAATARAERVFVTAHPVEPPATVVLRAGEAALRSYVDDMLGAFEARPVQVAVEPLRLLFARHLRERLSDDPAGELYATVTAAAAVAALDLALAEWVAGGASADDVAACHERFRAVAPLLPGPP
jgi:hypothetical protein